MTKASYREALPQLGGGFFLTDGGMETTLVFHDGVELPGFASFPLVGTEDGRRMLRGYFDKYGAIARRHGAGLILDTPTWRANSDWGRQLGFDGVELAEVNRRAVDLLREFRDEVEDGRTRVVVGGCLGPRGDGYVPGEAMSAEQAAVYHRPQIETLTEAGADMIVAMTVNYAAEALGIVRASRDAGMPVVLSFTVETDGRLPTGQPLGEAVEQVEAETGGYPAYYMLNCAHPSHFEGAFAAHEAWTERFRGIRANASRRSHAELNEAPELDIGDPEELGRDFVRLHAKLPKLNVMGGCCGTDDRHIERIAAACRPLFG